MKKVGVEFTPNCSVPRVRTAVMSSSSFWSARHLSKLSWVKPACLATLKSSGARVAAHEGPGLLGVEQRGDQREGLVAAGAARQHGGGRRQVVERELAE